MVVLVLVLAAALVAVVLATQRPSSPPPSVGVPAQPRLTALGRETAPPWPAPADAAGAVRQAGLPLLSGEGTIQHLHAHLDIVVNGKPVPVPAEIGIDEQTQRISPVHTHDPTGVVHVESPSLATFSLGQVFTEWQVALAADRIGGLRTEHGQTLQAYVNGRPVAGDPAAITLHPHDEIALIYSPASSPAPAPASYPFHPGE